MIKKGLLVILVVLLAITFAKADSTPPTIGSILESPDPVNFGENVLVNVDVTDQTNVETVWIEINNTNYTLNNNLFSYLMFEDDFESNDLSNWSLAGPGAAWSPSTSNPYQGTYHAIVEPNDLLGSFLEKNFTTLGLNQLMFEFYLTTPLLDPGDSFMVEWYDGSTWETLLGTHDEAEDEFLGVIGYRRFGVLLPPSAGNKDNITIRLGCYATGINEECHLDNFKATGLANSLTAFEDDMESNDISNWTLSGSGNSWYVETANPYQGTYHLRAMPQDLGGSFLDLNITTIGYSDINFEFYGDTIGLDIADSFIIEWYDGINWETLLVTHDEAADEFTGIIGYKYFGFSLPQSALNKDNITIRIGCYAGGINEVCDVDNFKVSRASQDSLWNRTLNTSLFPGGLNNYIIYANDSFNNNAPSQNSDFTINVPDLTPPILLDEDNETTSSSGAIIYVTTDDLTNITIDYGPDLTLSTSISDAILSQNHELILTGLNPSTVYYYNVTVCNTNDLCTISGTYNFTTSSTSSPPSTSGEDSEESNGDLSTPGKKKPKDETFEVLPNITKIIIINDTNMSITQVNLNVKERIIEGFIDVDKANLDILKKVHYEKILGELIENEEDKELIEEIFKTIYPDKNELFSKNQEATEQQEIFNRIIDIIGNENAEDPELVNDIFNYLSNDPELSDISSNPTTYNTITKTLSLLSGSSFDDFLLDEDPDEDYTIVSNIDDDNVNYLEIRFKVSKRWLLDNGIDKGMIVLYQFDDDWNQLDTWIIIETPEDVHYVAKADKFGQFKIRAEKPLERPLNQITGAVVGARLEGNELIVTGAFIMLIGYLGLYQIVYGKGKGIKIKKKKK